MEYFNAEQVAADYEKQEGRPLDNRIVAIIQTVEPYINQAYAAGYQDGIAADRKAEVINQ